MTSFLRPGADESPSTAGPLRFDGRVALVTGAGNGLGRAHALLLAARGARVVVNDLGGSVTGQGADIGPAEAIAREIRDQGGEAVADTHSVATPEGGEAAVTTALDAYGRIDIVVHNAGILRDAPFPEMTGDRLDPVLDVHLKGGFYVTRPAWTRMQSQGYGRVVLTSSSAGILGCPGKTNYSAAKMGLVGLTRSLAAEGAKDGITVNAVAPTAATRMLAAALEQARGRGRPADDSSATDITDNLADAFTSQLDPALVSPVIAYLAHESCAVTGEIYTAGAGAVARLFVGRTRGYFDPALSPENVRDHLAQIRDEAGYTVPTDSGEEITDMFKAIREGLAQ